MTLQTNLNKMKVDEIRETLINYYKLVELAKCKINVLCLTDDKYNTAKGVTDISFYGDIVSVTCDDSSMGYYDSLSFNFPLIYLSIDDVELHKVVLEEKENRLEKERIEKEKQKLKEENDKELREKEYYEKLKIKFGKE